MKKLLSLFLSAVMVLSCASQTVFAATTALTETEMESLETPLLTVFSDSGLPSERVNTTPSKYLFKSASGDSKQYILLKNVNANVSDKTEDVYFVMPEGYTQKGAAYNTTPYGATQENPGTKTAEDTKFDAQAENSLAKAMNADSYITQYFPTMKDYIKTNTWYTEAGYQVDAYSTDAKIALLSVTEYAQNADRISLKPNGESLQWWLRTPHIQADTKYAVWEFVTNGRLAHAWNLNSTYAARVVRPCFYIGESFFKNVKLDMALLKTEDNAVAEIIKNIANTDDGLNALKEIYSEAELAELGISAGGVQITSAVIEGTGQCDKAITATVTTDGEATKTEYEWILEKDGTATTLLTTEENTYTVKFADLGASIKCFVKVYSGETLSHTAYTNAVTTEAKPVLPSYNAIVDGAVAETPAQYKFTVDGKEMILLESVNAGENDGQFVTLEDPVSDSSLLWYDGLTADMGFMYDPADSNSIAAKINSEAYYNNIISANVAPYVNTHRWWNEPVNSTVANGDVRDAYATESKLALLSYTEYVQNASRIGYKTDNTIATLLRTPQYNWNGPRKGNPRVLLISTAEDADANSDGVQRMTVYNTTTHATYGGYYLKSIGFYVNPDMFANVKIGFTAENTEVIAILREKLAGKELEDLRAIGYSDDEIRVLFPDMEIVPPPVFPTYTSVVLNGTVADGVKETPAQYKFAVDGREMILLKSVNATEKDGQFVTLEVPVSDTSLVYYDVEDPSEIAEMTKIIYDPVDEKSIAWDVNQTSLWDKETKASASGAKAKVIPDSVRGYLNTHKWWNEGINNSNYTQSAWTTKSKVAILSYTEFRENIDRIGWNDENGCAMVLRTARYDNAGIKATPANPYFIGIGTGEYVEGTEKYRFTQIGITAGKEDTYLYWHSKPLGFYLNPQFFADVKVDFTAENTEVIAILREKLASKTVDELLNMGYSYADIKILFPSYETSIEDVEMYDFSLSADTETAGKYTLTYVCENTTAESISVNPVLAVYNGSQLISADVKAETVGIDAGKTATVTFTFETGSIDVSNVSVKTFVWDIETLEPYAAAKENELLSLRDKTWQAASTDAALTYYGRWEETSTAALANWNNPYVKFDFTGTTLKADFEGTVNISYEIDGEVKTANGVTGEKVLASGLNDTVHTAQITITNANSKNGIKSVETSEGGDISKTTEEKKYIQFIGDSITTDSRSYSYTIPKTYDYDYSIISMSGIALQDGAGWYYSSGGQVWSGLLAREDSVGMESAYFSTKSPKYGYSVDENGALQYTNPAFDAAADNAPDVIVIGLGTNDSAYVRNNDEGIGGADFTQTYVEFVNSLSTLYPNAQIYILRQFNNITDNGSGKNLSADYDAMREATVNAVNALSSNAKVHYVDTSDWDVEISTDNVHPTANGYAALGEYVYNAIKGSL